MKLAITGATGFVFSKLRQILSKKHQLFLMGYDEGIDIVNKNVIEEAISSTAAETILHFAAYTNVDEAERQKKLGEYSPVWKINVQGTENIAKYAKKYNKKLIHISTDMVFGGIEQELYHEFDQPAPINYYGITKYEAEQKVLESEANATIIRIAFPYTWEAPKEDYSRLFIKLLKEGKHFNTVADMYFAPTYIEDIAIVLQLVLERKLTGIIHCASGEKLSGYTIARQLAEYLGYDISLVQKTTRAQFFKDKAPRSKNTTLHNDTLNSLNIKLRSLKETMKEIPDSLRVK
jgi:dTDP-4-dehydrorhamnose reductase